MSAARRPRLTDASDKARVSAITRHVINSSTVRPGDTLVVALGDLPATAAREVDRALSASLPGVRVLCVPALSMIICRDGQRP